ncbi:MAG TPA: hypothetical protein VIV11_33865 [Kofleriaceae bacterium]
MPSGTGRPAWHKPVLVLAVVLVVAQVVAFVVIRRSRGEQKPAQGTVALTTSDAAVIEQPREEPRVAPPVDAAVEVVQQDAAVEVTTQKIDTTNNETVERQPKQKKLTRAELLAQQKKEKEERRREEERQRQEQEDRERARKKLEQERASAEQARMAAEIEKQKLAKERAEAEAAQARAAAEKARLEAIAKQKQQETPVEPKVDVLVLVLGPSTPSMSAEQIRNVYLGRSSVWPNGTTARPMNRPTGTAAAKKFYGSILRMSGGAFVEHWSEIQLSGGGIAPPVISSGKTVVSKVGATSGGFGYVMESELPADTSSVRLVRLK